MSQPILQVSHLSVEINRNKILNDLSFSLNAGETMAVIGPNGAGKTVLFRTLLGLIPHTGTVVWNKNIIGYVPQRLFIEPDLPLSVTEFFHLKNLSSEAMSESLKSVNFSDISTLLHQKIGTLSGGQLQRVLIAWAVADHPQILLFDEPTTGVDISAENSIYNLLHQLQQKEKLTLILISHELQVVYRYADQVLCLNKEGICFGPPKEALSENTLKELFGEHTSIYHHQHQV